MFLAELCCLEVKRESVDFMLWVEWVFLQGS